MQKLLRYLVVLPIVAIIALLLALPFSSQAQTPVPTPTASFTPTPFATFTPSPSGPPPTPFPTGTAPFQPTLPPAPAAGGIGSPADTDCIATSDDLETLSIGDSVEGELTASAQTVCYILDVEEGDVITITMVSDSFDTYLSLQDESGFELITDDDSAGNLDSRILAYEITSDDTYYIEAQSFSFRTGSSATGTYTLSVGVTEIRNIEYTQQVEGELSASAPNALFRFTGEAGDLISITMSSDNFSPYLILADQNGYQIAYSDYNSGRTATIGPVTLPYSAEYTITAQSSSGIVEGTYTLSVGVIEVSELDFDDPVEVEVSEGQPAYFGFEASAGDLVSITVDSGNTVDTRISVLGPDNYEIISDDDSGRGFDPEITNLVITQTGSYSVVIRPFSDSGEGTVTVTLTQVPVPSLDDGAQTVELGEKQQRALLVFEGEAGQQVEFTFTGLNGAQPYINISQGGFTITSISSGPVESLTVVVTIPSDGEVQIQIEDYSYSNIEVEVSAEVVGGGSDG